MSKLRNPLFPVKVYAIIDDRGREYCEMEGDSAKHALESARAIHRVGSGGFLRSAFLKTECKPNMR